MNAISKIIKSDVELSADEATDVANILAEEVILRDNLMPIVRHLRNNKRTLGGMQIADDLISLVSDAIKWYGQAHTLITDEAFLREDAMSEAE